MPCWEWIAHLIEYRGNWSRWWVEWLPLSTITDGPPYRSVTKCVIVGGIFKLQRYCYRYYDILQKPVRQVMRRLCNMNGRTVDLLTMEYEMNMYALIRHRSQISNHLASITQGEGGEIWVGWLDILIITHNSVGCINGKLKKVHHMKSVLLLCFVYHSGYYLRYLTVHSVSGLDHNNN